MTAFLFFISNLIIPVLILLIVMYGFRKKCNVYDAFIKGAEKGYVTVLQILPTLTGLMMAVGVLRASGILDMAEKVFGIFLERAGFQTELIPLILAKMVSSSAATGFLLDIFQMYGPDSEVGMTASILMSCTETIFYTMSVYFMAAGIKKTRYTLPGALLVSIVGTAAAVWLGRC